MLKRCVLVLIAAGAISAAVPFVAAQDGPPPPDQQSNGQPIQGPAASMPMGPGHRGGPDPQQRVKHLTKELSLTSDEQAKVLSILQSEKSQTDAIHQDSSVAPQDMHAKMMQVHQDTDAQIRATLDSNQQQKWDAMQARRGQWAQGHRGGPPDGGDQGAPPPPQ